MVVAMWGGGDTQTLLTGKKIKLYALSDGGDTKTFPSFLVLAFSPVLMPNYKPLGKKIHYLIFFKLQKAVVLPFLYLDLT